MSARLSLRLTVACVGIAAGTLREITAWVYDQMVARDAIPGKMDTIIDLLLDTAGAILAGLIIVRMSRSGA